MYKQKAKMKSKEILKGRKGITLIALVITIIVLLILAGVSIAMLTGDNGILTKASDSANKSKEAEEREKISLSYSAAMVDNDGKGVTQSNFETELKKYDNGITVTEDEENNNFKVTYPNGHEYTVESNGKIEETVTNPKPEVPEKYNPNELTIGVLTAQNTDKYGWKVKNYNVKYNYGENLDKESDVWRLFYQDEKYTYLITDELVGNYRPSMYYEENSKYSTGENMSIEGKKLNKKLSTLFKAEGTKANDNVRATVWFTDTTNELWAKYKDTNGNAVFSIASPTAELFEASYNNNTNTTHNAYQNHKINVKLGNYGYEDNTDLGWFKKADSHGIYNKDETSNWWVASPGGNYDTYYCLDVGGSNRLF